jgi:aldehyde dehydrogenase (NAD+)
MSARRPAPTSKENVVTATVSQDLPISDAARAHISQTIGNVIDGAVGLSDSGRTTPVFHPPTGQQIAEATDSSVTDVDRAVASARAAFEDGRWRLLAPFEKERRLRRFSELIAANADLLADLDVLDNGMPRSRARYHMNMCAELAAYYAGWPSRLDGVVHPAPPGLLAYSIKEPVGVVAAIIPWNGPTAAALWKLGPALATGNSIILKPAEQTPLSAVSLAQICLEAGIPDGVVNVVQGAGETAGAALVAHRDVDKVAFTGSTQTGRVVQAAAAKRLKRVTLELGGKAANIVYADADLNAAAKGVVAGAWASSGQVCMAGSRLVVERSIAGELVERVVTLTRPLKLGSGFESSTDLGPLVSSEQLDRVTGYIATGKQEGASVALGGEPVDSDGYFVAPTVFTNVDNSMTIAREEIFGPVLAVIPFDSEAEALSIANDTEYGLTSGVWTSDMGKAQRAVGAIRTGLVWVNTYAELLSNMPYGGMKQSGFGRELGEAALDMYTETKSVVQRHQPPA